jgi:protein-L-isoaspartate(D-aspartate) O-methyltransferase
MGPVWMVILSLVTFLIISKPLVAEDWQKMREEMIHEIEIDAYQTRKYLGKDTLDTHVMAAVARVPRHEFVPVAFRDRAYLNQPLPIGRGQTISQPFIVALMTDLLQVDKTSKVYELGTGSGYQAAVLAELVESVYSVEIVPTLAEEARDRLARLGYTNVYTRAGDGFYGWPEEAPFDGIIVTAAGLDVPDTLLDQLKPGGRMVIPVGEQHAVQQLLVVSKEADGTITKRNVLPVMFVPITGKH